MKKEKTKLTISELKAVPERRTLEFECHDFGWASLFKFTTKIIAINAVNVCRLWAVNF